MLRAIDAYPGEPVTRLGPKLLALTFVRTEELIPAEGREFNIDDALWIVPAARVKKVRGKSKVRIDDVQHLMPLPSQALDVLAELKPFNGSSEFICAQRCWELHGMGRRDRRADRRHHTGAANRAELKNHAKGDAAIFLSGLQKRLTQKPSTAT